MRKILLLSAMLIASVFTAKAQLELSGSVTTNPRTDWTADEYAYDMSQVATYLGYEDVAAFEADLWAFVRGESTEIDMWNISHNGTETNTQRDNSATAWFWDPAVGDWVSYSKGCFWLDLDGEESGWYAPAAFWTQVTWDAENNALYHGIGQNGSVILDIIVSARVIDPAGGVCRRRKEAYRCHNGRHGCGDLLFHVLH